MVSLNSIVRFLNAELRIKNIPDASRNGLQVRVPKEIRKVGFAVDASLTTFEKAARAGCDLVIVHHGIKWKGLRDRTGLQKRRIAFLKRQRINLYAAHLPLDVHPVYGNNAELARLLGLTRIEKFGKYKGRALGYKGRLPAPRTVGWVASTLKRRIKADCKVLRFGRPGVRTIGIVSGGGSDAIVDAYKERIECFVTGEAPHHIYHEAKDLKKNVIVAGHYATETTGVKALMPFLRGRFGVNVHFIDVPASTQVTRCGL
jgi:dinuclear metal center YbgI/SA1388 family protein